jgi:hypothetical protein
LRYGKRPSVYSHREGNGIDAKFSHISQQTSRRDEAATFVSTTPRSLAPHNLATGASHHHGEPFSRSCSLSSASTHTTAKRTQEMSEQPNQEEVKHDGCEQ